jgi:hypothetical protein
MVPAHPCGCLPIRRGAAANAPISCTPASGPGATLMTDDYELYSGIARAHQLIHLAAGVMPGAVHQGRGRDFEDCSPLRALSRGLTLRRRHPSVSASDGNAITSAVESILARGCAVRALHDRIFHDAAASRSILVICTGRIGDVLLCTPVVHSLKARWPTRRSI